MRKMIFFIAACIFLGACSNKNEVPKKIIQPHKMGLILWDMLRVQYLAEFRAESDSLINKEVETKNLTANVFAIHKISPANFNKSYNWYVGHPEKLKVILDSLQVQKQRANDRILNPGSDTIKGPATKRLIQNNKSLLKATE